MVLGLLTLAAIPTTIGVAEGVSSTRKTSDNDSSDPTTASTTEADRMRKFHLRIYCDASSPKASQIHGKLVHLRDDRLVVHTSKPVAPPSSPFLGFYVPYPDPSRRPHPSPLGLVSFIASDPPTLNWIYVDASTSELRYGNRTASISHIVGPWAWDTGDSEDSDDDDDDDDDDGGGLVLNGEERAIAIETEDGVWRLFWEPGNGVEGGGSIPGMKGKRKLR
ncbi:MAG: hypothetical protein Q9214_002860, partial [Letrouitia sp. 1 TL-2023]